MTVFKPMKLLFLLIQPGLLATNERLNRLFHFNQPEIHPRIDNRAVIDLALCAVFISHRT